MTCPRCTASSRPAHKIASWVKPCLVAALCWVGSSATAADIIGQPEVQIHKDLVARPGFWATFSGALVGASSAKPHHSAWRGDYVSAPAAAARHGVSRALQEDDHDHEEGEEHEGEHEEHEGEEGGDHDHDDHADHDDHDHEAEEGGGHADHDDHDDHDHAAEAGGDHADHDDHDDHDEEGIRQGATPWGRALGAAFLVNIVTLVGVIFLGPGSKLLNARGDSLTNRGNSILYSFAAGALLATAFFLLLLEASHLLAAVYEEENEVSWRWGTSILVGYMVSFVGDLITSGFLQYGGRRPSWFDRGDSRRSLDVSASNVPRRHSNRALETEATAPSNGTSVVVSASGSPAQAGPQTAVVLADPEAGDVYHEKPGLERDVQTEMRVRFGVLLGDFFHNFVDGVFIGAGFMLCGESKGWAIAAGTIYHEIAQEFADYFALTGIGGMRPRSALALNFLSGLSVVFGVITVLAADVSNAALGALLAFGGGVYIHVGATESLPKVYASVESVQDRVLALISFCASAATIGLVLLDHGHCEAGGHAHDH